MNKPADVPAQAGGNFWKEYAAEEWTDAVVACWVVRRRSW